MFKTALLGLLSLVFITGFTFLTTTWTFDDPTTEDSIFYKKEENQNWLIVKEDVQIRASEIAEKYIGQLGLGMADELRLYRTNQDDIGFTHYRYQHYHNDVKVTGSQLLVHEKDGFVKTLNGKLARGMNMEVGTQISEEKAIEIAIAKLPADSYMWESRMAEDMLKRIKNDPDATYYPQAELVLVDPTFKLKLDQFELAYSVVVHSKEPEMRKRFFIDAVNGSVIHEINLLHSQSENIPGIAETRYHGTREIITDSIGVDSFRLVETTRGRGIETYDMNNGTNIDNAVNFLDDDNFWDNVNAEQDEAATDAHWSAEMTFDYYLQMHNHLGVDGDSMALISYVHVNSNWTNATWNGSFARFGDSSPPNSPLTSLDVVGHEFTHGITDFTADLVYQDESGALNESFSDIFGESIEFWADSASGDWLVGANFLVEPFRSMSNPREFGDPDTYFGDGWVTGTGDNGGVHTNSGVQNYWFYLLTEGGADTNDIENIFVVHGLGIDTAAQIAFRNLKYYLTVTSEYEDARLGAIQAAEDLFGPCSFPVKQTISAWYAVGVGPENAVLDFNLLAILEPLGATCGVSDQELVTVQLVYNDCDSALTAGVKVPLFYQINGGAEIWDTLLLTNQLQGGDSIMFTFSTPVADLAVPGTYTLTCGANLPGDNTSGNNSKQIELERIFEQNIDLGSVGVREPLPKCYMGVENVAVEIGFFGCDSINAGEPLEVYYSLNGAAPVQETIVLPNTLFRGETIVHTFSQPADLSEIMSHGINVWATYMPDTLNANDSLFGHFVVNPVPITIEDIVTFEDLQTSMDSFYYLTSSESRTFLSTDAAREGLYGLQVTGGDVLNEFLEGRVTIPEQDTIWEINPQFRSKVCFCADLTSLQEAELRFRIKQTFSEIYEVGFGVSLNIASAARVLVDGVQISPDYFPLANTNSPYFPRKLDLADYLGNAVEICFETSTLIDKESDPFGIGDNVYLDNVELVGSLVSVDDKDGFASLFDVYPNPGTGNFNIEIEVPQLLESTLKVFDSYGRRHLERQIQLSQGYNKVNVDLAGFAPGIYYFQLQSDDRVMVKEVVIF